MNTSSGDHHLHLRKRVYKRLEQFPSTSTLKRILDRAMLFVAIVGPVALLPQVIQVLTLKDASDLSLITWGTWEVLSLLWLTYGILHKETPIIISNTCYLVLQAIILYAIFTY